MKFPSREWCEAAAAAMVRDPAVIAAIADFGPVVAGVVIERGEGLSSDFCALARIEPGKAPQLSYPEDEDELEEFEPDYVGWVSYSLCKDLLEQTFLEWLRSQLDRRQQQRRALLSAGRFQECVGVVRHEVRIGEVALEYRSNLLDHIRVARFRNAHIPLQTGHLGRVCKVRRTDITGGESRCAMK